MQKCVSACHENSALNFSFHTIEFKLGISGAVYSSVLNVLLYAKCRTRPTQSGRETIWNSNIFSGRGILVTLKETPLMSDGMTIPYFSLNLRVNPRILVGDGSYIGVYETSLKSNELLICELNCCIILLGLLEYIAADGTTRPYTIEDFFISRLDLCVNYKFESDYVASHYLKLLRRGNRCKFFSEATTYDHTSKRQLPYRNELHLSAKSFDLVVYSKKAQMEDNLDFFDAVPNAADGLLRFEMRLRRIKLRRLLHGMPNVNLLQFLAYIQQLCRSEFERYTKTLFCTGDYYTLSGARELIRERDHTYHSVAKIHFLEAVSENKSLYDTICEYEQEGKSCRYLLEGLSKLGVNPVTIPERWFGPSAIFYSIPNLLGFCPINVSNQAQEAFSC